MGKRGKKPKPEALRIAEGIAGRPRPVVRVRPGEPPMPFGLGKVGQECWNQMVAILSPLNMLSDVDAHSLFSYCEAWEDYREAMTFIEKNGAYGIDKMGNPCLNGAYRKKIIAGERLRKLGALFGWAPADRVGISAPQPQDAEIDAFKVG